MRTNECGGSKVILINRKTFLKERRTEEEKECCTRNGGGRVEGEEGGEGRSLLAVPK